MEQKSKEQLEREARVLSDIKVAAKKEKLAGGPVKGFHIKVVDLDTGEVEVDSIANVVYAVHTATNSTHTGAINMTAGTGKDVVNAYRSLLKLTTNVEQTIIKSNPIGKLLVDFERTKHGTNTTKETESDTSGLMARLFKDILED